MTYLQQFRLTECRALITGGGTGMGRAMAVAFAEAGASWLILTGRRLDKLEATARQIRDQGRHCQVTCIQADVTRADDRARIVHAVQALPERRLDILVNNAGTFAGAKIGDCSEDILRLNLAVNLEAPFMLMHDLLPALKKSERASVLNISSTLADKPIPATAAYNAAKAGLVQLTRTAALELGGDGIRVNAILPAIVDTPMYRGRYASDEEFRKALPAAAGFHPLGRIGTPEDIASAALFLSSPAASWITGVALPVDGGMLCT